MSYHRESETPQPGRGTALFVANTDWYLFNFRRNLIKRAEANGWTVRLACDDTGYKHALNKNGWPVTIVPLSSRGANPVRELWSLYRLVRVLRSQRPDVVHLFTLKCVLYGCLAAPFTRGTRVIGALTGMGYLFTSKRLSVRALKQVVMVALRVGLKVSNAHLIFQNEPDRREFVDNGLVPVERTSVIRGSGVDCSVFNRQTRIPASVHPRLLFCGRLIEEKGIRSYLAATAALCAKGYQFKSRIAGEPYPGNPSSLSETEVAELAQDSQHEYLGHHEDMPGLLAQTDIVVLPTYYREGTPKVLLEASAAGCLIVTTTIPACDGIVDDGVNGYRVPPQDAQSLSQALAKLLDRTPDQRETMSIASSRIARERFSDTQVNEQTLALYEPTA